MHHLGDLSQRPTAGSTGKRATVGAFGFVLLSIGTALYAAAMSSVKAVKLSMKFEAT
jgi:hypothetical protein